MIDAKLLPTWENYETLPDVITIWILPYDPFGENRMLYTVKNMVVENPKISYNDGSLKIFLYTHGEIGGNTELKNLLTYLESTNDVNAVDNELAEIQKIVKGLKSSEELRGRYMKIYGVIDYEKRDSYEDGYNTGKQDGIRILLETLRSLDIDKSKAKSELMKTHELSEEAAEEYLKKYW